MDKKPPFDLTSKETQPYNHYREMFAQKDPHEISLRCNVAFDEGTGRFTLRFLSETITLSHPGGIFYDQAGKEFLNYPTAILLLHHLCEGGWARAGEKDLTYRDVPSGEVYYRQFEGRCIMRLAYGFGRDLDAFERGMARMNGVKMAGADCAWRFELLEGFTMSFLLWKADEEFPPSAQILFSDNFPAGFTAEDMAVAGDVSISRLKQKANET